MRPRHPGDALVKAVQAFPDGLRVLDVPAPQPGPGEVLVRVAGAGLCHSDCMISKVPQAFGRSDGMTIGHETAGWRVDTGQPVIVHSEFGCGACAMCRRGAERFCPELAPSRGAGQGHDGGMAEFIKVPARALVALPESIDPVDAGPLLLRGSHRTTPSAPPCRGLNRATSSP